MKSNLKREAYLNLILRGYRGVSRRLRGWIYVRLGMFQSSPNHPCIMLASGARFINSKNIYLSNGVAFGYMARIESHLIDEMPSHLTIGENTTFGDNVHIGAVGDLRIGKNVLGGSNILIIDHNHGEIKRYLNSKAASTPRSRKIMHSGKITIGDNVWIGDNVIILGGTDIGFGSIVAAGGKVRGIYPAYSLIRD